MKSEYRDTEMIQNIGLIYEEKGIYIVHIYIFIMYHLCPITLQAVAHSFESEKWHDKIKHDNL